LTEIAKPLRKFAETSETTKTDIYKLSESKKAPWLNNIEAEKDEVIYNGQESDSIFETSDSERPLLEKSKTDIRFPEPVPTNERMPWKPGAGIEESPMRYETTIPWLKDTGDSTKIFKTMDVTVKDKNYKAEGVDKERPLAEDEKNERREEIGKYIDDLKNNAEYPETINNNMDPEELKKISPEENAKMREEFNRNKAVLIKEWEEKNGKEWPTYKEDVYNENGIRIRKAGDKYDAHHVNPLELGGKNTSENITPIHASKHYDSQGIHAPESPYRNLVNTVKETN
jgi:hypothetical protein